MIIVNNGRGSFCDGLPGGAGCAVTNPSPSFKIATQLLQLPLRFGGCGLASVARTADPAFIGAAALAGDVAAFIVNFVAPFARHDALDYAPDAEQTELGDHPALVALPALTAAITRVTPHCKDPPASNIFFNAATPKVQGTISVQLAKHDAEAFACTLALPDAPPDAKLLYHSVCAPKSGAWLSTHPTRDFRARLPNDTFCHALGLRLGLPFIPRGMSALPDCHCQQAGPHDSRHRLQCSCPVSASHRTRRHHAVTHAFMGGVGKDNVSLMSREHPVDSVVPRKQARGTNESLVADVLIHLKKPSDESAASQASRAPPDIRIIDFAIASPFATSAVASCRAGQPIPAGYAARAKERSKFKKYTDFYIIPDKQFVPAVIETHGGFGHDFLRLLDELYDPGTSASKAAVAAAGAKKAHMIRILSVCVQIGNFLPVLAAFNPADKRVQPSAGAQAKQRRLAANAAAANNIAAAPAAADSVVDLSQPLSPASHSALSVPPPECASVLSALPSAAALASGPGSLHQPLSAGPMTDGGSV